MATTIGNIASLNSDCLSSLDNWSCHNYLDTGNITENKIASIQTFDTQQELPSRAKRKIKPNSIIYSTVRPEQKHYGIIRNYQTENLIVSTGFVVIDVDNKLANPNYVYYFLVQDSITSLLQNIAAQSTSAYPSIRPSDIANLTIDLPPRNLQDKIANLLGTIEEQISVNDSINDNLETQAKLLFDEWFVKDGGSKTAGAEDEVLGNVISVVKKTFNPEKEPEIELEHYSIPAFDAGKFPAFDSSLSIKSNKYIVDKDCFMISKLNPTTKRVWRPYCLTSHAVCSTEFIVFKAKESAYTDFLYSLINCDVFSEHLCNHVTGSTGSRQRTNPDDALKFMFKLPTKATIAEFSSIVAPMYDQIRTNAIENNSLRQLRDYLLPLLMSGQISIGG